MGYLLCDLSLCDITYCSPAHYITIDIMHMHAFQFGIEYISTLIHKPEFTGCLFFIIENFLQMCVEYILIAVDVRGKTLLDQMGSFYTKFIRACKIYLNDQSVFIKSKITNRGKIIQVAIPVACILKFFLYFAKLFILHFQLNFVHLELMNKALGIARRQLFQ